MLKSPEGPDHFSAQAGADRISPQGSGRSGTGMHEDAPVSFSEKKFFSKTKADLAGAVHYWGRPCAKHLELEGKRSARNGNCVGCNRDKMRSRRAAEPDRFRAYNRAAYEKNKEKYLARASVRGRLRRTGMDHETYLGLLALQDGKCAVCRHQLIEGRAHADHCHDSKTPRGILCATCNQAEGLIKRSGLGPEEWCERLAIYLANPPAKKL